MDAISKLNFSGILCCAIRVPSLYIKSNEGSCRHGKGFEIFEITSHKLSMLFVVTLNIAIP